MSAGNYNFTIEQGATFSETYTWKDGSGTPVNLTGYTAKMQIRDKNDLLLVDVGVSGTLAINAASGTVTVTIPATVTRSITWHTGKYDLFLTSASNTKKLLKGEVSLEPSETQ